MLLEADSCEELSARDIFSGSIRADFFDAELIPPISHHPSSGLGSIAMPLILRQEHESKIGSELATATTKIDHANPFSRGLSEVDNIYRRVL